MDFRVVILDAAEQDLKELRTYILKNFSLETWRTTYGKIKEAIRNLQNFPQAGAIPEEIEKLNLTQYRQVLSGMNRVIYEVRQDVIYIHIVVDARRDMNALLTRRLLRIS
ncbi:type II toxin-antitoxin system RelE/ParE family toxin [Undibacterium sp. Jales W-56]|uniref:type II toxin-antitoxin system RelE/ParE family toxin n=1 Tax=Undibacterium sp. Jales W-56 TaxID=2897325 RepID=UPI0021D00A3E|nr:type II toxin-antitoxin system RelE/ParE family toxin [Undibacterium sp. Jales W-56]MCU6432552.1 type II toxin-antitoxin system RelE/ParE family toxin [Undibacterium sp. Jales W-56]